MAYKGEFDTVQINGDTYKIAFPKLNLDVKCDHEFEITGKTGHEYAVAVPDGQVLIKRINGQTGVKSGNTLVNSKCNLKSIGRNFYNSDYFDSNNKVILKGTTISSSTDTNIDISPKKKFVFLKGVTYYFRKLNITGTLPWGRIVVEGTPWSSSAAEGGNKWYFDTDNTSFTAEQDIVLKNFYFAKKSSGDSFSFDLQITTENSEELIPYEESSMRVDKELGEFDYIDNQSHLLINQTSQIITINASNITSVEANVNSAGTHIAYTNIDTTGAVSEWDTVCGVANNGFTVKVLDGTWVQNKTLGVCNNTLFMGSNDCSSLQDFRALCPIKFVFKKATPTTEAIQLEAGYQVWSSGLQIQETETLPYILEKEYAVSLSSQVLANTSLISSLPKAEINDTTLIL